MDRIIIRGGKRLEGKICISGAKNAALTLLPCALLTAEPPTLRKLPRLADVASFGLLLNQHDASTTNAGPKPAEVVRLYTLQAPPCHHTSAPLATVRQERPLHIK